MKKLLLSILVATMCGTVYAWEGSGTMSDPWLIKTVEDLQTLSANSVSNNYSGMYFRMENDIIFRSGERLAPIQTFGGTFDGNDQTLYSFDINDSSTNNLSIFVKLTSSATVKNLRIASKCEIIGSSYVGGIAATNEGTISNCISQATVRGTDNVGGIAAKNKGIITDCTVRGEVTGTDGYIGGIAAVNEGTMS